MKMNRKGFSLVEILAVIVIVGTLSFFAISSITRYIDSSRKEKVAQDKKNVSMAAQLYLQSNRNLYPKLIGDETRINLSDLKKKSYLKEDIVNDAGESCMEKSFVRVYKLNEGDYSYTTYLYCGDDDVPAQIDIPKPVIEDFKFTGGSQNANGSFNDVKDAKFSFTMKGAADDINVGIYSYSYQIYVRSNEAGSIYTLVYDSESIKGGLEPVIKISSKNLASYMSITGYSNIRVDVSVINEQGAKTDFSTSTGEFEDKQAPICGETEGEAQDDSDWINKKSFGNKDAIVVGTRSYPARVSVDCNDGAGSGCKRDRFTKSWPNDYESVSGKVDYNLGARWSYIEIEDNSSTTNKTRCYVRANVDLQAPELNISIYKLKADGTKGDRVLTKTVKDGDQINATMPEGTIKASDYANVVGAGAEKWLNKANYPYGITIDVELKDNLYLLSYDWTVNKPLEPTGSGDSKLTSTASDTNARAEQNGGTAISQAYTSDVLDNPKNDDELKKAEHGLQSASITGLKLTREGKRYAKLVVCDKAQNCTTLHVYANIDRTAPPVPTVSFTKQGTTTSYTPATASNYKNTTNWSNVKINSFIKDQQVDNINADSSTLSGWQRFVYKYSEQSSSQYSWKTAVEKDAANNSFGIGFALTQEGIHKIQYKSCDKASNCSNYGTEHYVKIDTVKPTCDVVKTYKDGKKPNAAGWLKKNEAVTLSLSCAEGTVYSSGCNSGHADNKKSTLYSTDINVNNAGAAGVNAGGYVWDYAGNKSAECPKNVTVKIDTIIPKCAVKATYKGTTGPNAAGWLKIGESVTIGNSCTDPKATNNVSSGCDSNNAKNKQQYNYNVDISTTTAGSKGVNSPGTVMDIAGNESVSCPYATVKIDHKAPACTTKIEYPQGNPTSGWLGKINNSTKKTAVVSQVCKDDKVNDVSSGCSGSMKSYTYKSEINTTTAGAGGNNNGGGKVKDAAGNSSSECPKDRTVRIDYTAPRCTPSANIGSSSGTAYTSGTWVNKNVVLTAICTERGSYRSECQSNEKETFKDDRKGNVHFVKKATDKAGNYDTCDTNYDVRIDKHAPIVSCSVTGHYKKDSDSKLGVSNNSYDKKDAETNNVASGIKTTTYSLDGGSYSATSSKKLSCKSDGRTAGVKIKLVDNAGNSASGTCSGGVSVPGCCSSTYHVNGSKCKKDGKKVTCGGGHYDKIYYSNYNGSKCKKEKEKGSKCATESCCSASNYKSCDWFTSCREGNTFVYTSGSLSTYAGVVQHHLGGTSNKLYYLKESSSSGYKVRTSGFVEHYNNSWVVWIYKNCVGPKNKVCPYSSCPG